MNRPRPRVPTTFSLAPMMDKTDRHFRYFFRLLTKDMLLYTEMINPDAIRFGDSNRHLSLGRSVGPTSLQLGSDDPIALAEAITMAENLGFPYEEYNLNVGCPSDRVQFRNIGACLMADPNRVAECVAAMREATQKPVTVKHRIGIRSSSISLETYENLCNFVQTVNEKGADGFTIHARIAILEGLSPKDNRSIPPLQYETVWRLKADFPQLSMEINGHIRSWEDAWMHLQAGMDGVMFGRVCYENPWIFSQADHLIRYILAQKKASTPLGSLPPIPSPTFTKQEILINYAQYIDEVQDAEGINPRGLIWPVLDLFPGVPGARSYRQILSQPIKRGTSVLDLAKKALTSIQTAT